MMLYATFLLPLLAIVNGKPVGSPIETTTSAQWLIISGTTVFWPTSTNYFYGPTEGPSASAVSCNAAWIEYNSRSRGLYSFGPTTVITSYTSYPTSTGACRTSLSLERWSDTHTGPLTTLCDGIPRALGPRETVTQVYPGTGPCSTGMSTVTEVDSLYREPSPSPTCTLATEDCIGIWSTFTSLSASYEAATPTPSPGDTNSPIRPAECPRTVVPHDPCTNCHFNVATATVFYWPVETTGGDLCSPDGTTVTATPTGSGPNTAVRDGITFTSPSIYISFESIVAASNRRVGPGGFCGATTHTSTMISVDPVEVSSVQKHRNGKYPTVGTAMPFNFADFDPQTLGNQTTTLIPWSAYRGGEQCPPDDPSCTMIRDDYTPWLSLPPAVRAIDPRWTECDLWWQLPVATLVALSDAAVGEPTATAAYASETPAATPQSAVAAPTPEPTGL